MAKACMAACAPSVRAEACVEHIAINCRLVCFAAFFIFLRYLADCTRHAFLPAEACVLPEKQHGSCL